MTELFQGCDIVSVRIIEDRELQRPKGFGYVEFTNAEGLTKALTLDGESFQGRLIRIKVADPRECTDIFLFFGFFFLKKKSIIIVLAPNNVANESFS